MNSVEYKKICEQPTVQPESFLKSTLLALKKAGAKEASLIEVILSSLPIPFPDKHTGNSEHFYKIECTELEAETITDILFDLEASSVPNDGIATSETYEYVSLVNVWSEITESV